MNDHIETGRFWANAAIARQRAGDRQGFEACHANAAHYAALAIDEAMRRNAEARRARQAAPAPRAWNGGGRTR